MASAPLEAWEIALNEVFTEQQQGLIFDKLKQGSEPGHLKVAEIWSSLHRASAEKLKGAIEGRVPELRAGTSVDQAVFQELTLLRLERQFATPSSSASATKHRQQQFRTALIDLYQQHLIGTNQLQCMITGLRLPAKEVIAGHLLARKSEMDALFLFGLDDIFHVRNGLLWSQPIEKAWSAGQIAILVDPTTGNHVFHVLSDRYMLMPLSRLSKQESEDRLRNTMEHYHYAARKQVQLQHTIGGLCCHQYGNMTFGDLDNRVITFPISVVQRPFQRMLVYAAAAAVALRKLKNDLRKTLTIDRGCLRALSHYDEEAKSRLNQWLEQAIPLEDICP